MSRKLAASISSAIFVVILSVNGLMLRARKHLKVLDAVVERISIDMMYAFLGFKNPAKMFRHHKTVFGDVVPISSFGRHRMTGLKNESVSTNDADPTVPARRVGSASKKSFALSGAKSDSWVFFKKPFSAVFTWTNVHLLERVATWNRFPSSFFGSSPVARNVGKFHVEAPSC